MQRRSSLTGSRRFSEIHRDGSSAANRLLVIRFLPNGLDLSRFGFLISKRIGNSVVRNKVKRRLREAVRASQVLPGFDALFIARRGTEGADYHDLKKAVVNLLERNRLLDLHKKVGPMTQAGRQPDKRSPRRMDFQQ